MMKIFFKGSFFDLQAKSDAPINTQRHHVFLLLCLINVYIYIFVSYLKTSLFVSFPSWTVSSIKVEAMFVLFKTVSLEGPFKL